MENSLTAQAQISIKAPPAQVWASLTTPETVKKWLFGTDVSSDWKVGSPIVYRGVWQEKPYEDKGIILELIPERIFSSTYWSGMSGLPDAPENYSKVTYALAPEDGGTRLTVSQDNVKTEESRKHSEENWAMVLAGLKKLLES